MDRRPSSALFGRLTSVGEALVAKPLNVLMPIFIGAGGGKTFIWKSTGSLGSISRVMSSFFIRGQSKDRPDGGGCVGALTNP